MALAEHGISGRTGTFISWSPVLAAVALAGAASLVIQAVSQIERVDTGAIYSGVFDLISIFTGFLATFYVFIVTKGNAFLEAIKGTQSFATVLLLVKFTVIWSAAIIGYSYLMMILNPSDFLLFGWEHCAVFFWLANVFLIAINFSRCASIFMTIAETTK